MTPRKIIEFKEAVESFGLKYDCDQKHLKKMTVTELSTMWDTLLERERESNITHDCVVSHHIGEWLGISLICSNNRSIGISESVKH